MQYSILTYGLIGCVIFTLFLVFMAYSGIASSMRDEEGKFKKEKNLKSVLGAILFLCFLLGLLFYANVKYTKSLPTDPSFMQLWLNSFGVFMVIHSYDLLVLDFLIIVLWHPKFLNLPNTSYYKTFRPHVIGFLKGLPIGILASLAVSILSFWIF